MGEAMYTMIAKWESEEKAQEAEPRVLEFLKQMGKAEDLWQEVRMKERDKPAEADTKLRTAYPEVFRILKIPITLPDEGLSYLAGLLSSPCSWKFWLERKNNIIRFSGMVWHFANWDPLSRAMREEFGAIVTKWWSDEWVQNLYSEEAWRDLKKNINKSGE